MIERFPTIGKLFYISVSRRPSTDWANTELEIRPQRYHGSKHWKPAMISLPNYCDEGASRYWSKFESQWNRSHRTWILRVILNARWSSFTEINWIQTGSWRNIHCSKCDFSNWRSQASNHLKGRVNGTNAEILGLSDTFWEGRWKLYHMIDGIIYETQNISGYAKGAWTPSYRWYRQTSQFPMKKWQFRLNLIPCGYRVEIRVHTTGIIWGKEAL
jgi:hypothetical protein